MSQIDETTIDLLLDGPGPVERCQQVVESMRGDGRVQSIEVQ